MIPDFSQDYFALFGLPRVYRVDMARLDQAYHAMQGKVHPDRHAHLPETERRLSMQWATQVNEAYRTLKQPLARAHYLLRLAGAEGGHESNTVMPAEFLMEQMEWREALGEATEAADEDALDDLSRRLRHNARALEAELARQLDETGDLDAAADSVRRMKFLEKLQHEINDALTALES